MFVPWVSYLVFIIVWNVPIAIFIFEYAHSHGKMYKKYTTNFIQKLYKFFYNFIQLLNKFIQLLDKICTTFIQIFFQNIQKKYNWTKKNKEIAFITGVLFFHRFFIGLYGVLVWCLYGICMVFVWYLYGFFHLYLIDICWCL